MEDVVTALNQKVGQIVTDAGWEGSEASAFTSNWETISAQVNAIGVVVIQTGSIVDQLGQDLSKIENALENAAGQAAAHGVQIGGDGQPPTVCYTNKTQEDWRLGYDSFYQQGKADAENAPGTAAGALLKIPHAIISGKPAKSGGGDPSQVPTRVGEGNTIADLLTDLLASPTAYASTVRAKVEEATTRLSKAQQAWLEAQKAARQAAAPFAPLPHPVNAPPTT